MKTIKLIVAAVALSLVQVAFSDVAFTGGAGGTSRDLSLAENWSGAPGASEVATVDVATFGGAFTASGSVAFNGLVFANATEADDVSVTGSGEIALGASGLSLGAPAKSFTLSAPVSLAAAQSWSFGATATVDFRSSVGGTADWTVDATGIVRVYRLGYGGFVDYTGEKGQVRFLGTTNWAKKVRLTATGNAVIAVTNTVEWSDIVTGGAMELTGLGNLFICQPSEADAGSIGEPGRLIFRDGDSLKCTESFATRSKALYVAQGVLDQRGGEIVGCDRYQPAIGGNSNTRTYNSLTTSSAGYEISGGTYSASFLSLGSGSKTADTGDDMKIVQKGGTVTARSGIWLIEPNYSSGIRGINEYILGGGLLNVGDNGNGGWNNAQTRDFVLAGAHATDWASAKTLPAGVLTITNGTLKARHVRFGVDKIDGQPYKNDHAFGLFDMRGGEMPLNAAINGTTTMTQGFDFGQYWNNGNSGETPHSVYRINLAGGTMSVASGDWVNRFGFFFSPIPGLSFTWDTGAGNTDFVAPISGSGTLCKKGAGTLTIRDGSCFDGTLDVAEGEATIPQTLGADDLPDDCYKWTADSLAGTDEGAEVPVWTDAVHGLKAEANGKPASKWCNPTFVSESEKFNGHAALAFSTPSGSASLVASNMLAGATSCSLVAVFRRTDTGADNAHAGHGKAVCGLGGSWGGTVLRLGARCTAANAPAVPYAYAPAYSSSDSNYWKNDYALVENGIASATGADAACQVMIVTLDNGRYSVFSDGQYNERTNTLWAANSKLEKDRQFFFGGYTTDGSTLANFIGEIAEIRVYPDKALTLAEQRRLGSHLFAKYRGVAEGESRTDLWHGPYVGAIETGAEPVPEKPAGGTSWDAAALNALNAPDGSGKPTLVEGTFGGEDAIHFDGTSALAIPAAASPLSGASAFTMAVVFRTLNDDATGLDDEKMPIDGSIGLVSSRRKTRSWDAQMTLVKECSLSVEWANGRADSSWRTRMVDRRPCRLNDSNPHVAVFAALPTSSTQMKTMVDGRFNGIPTSGTGMGADVWREGETFAASDVNIGVQCAASQAGYFTGDIAEVVLYPRQLTEEEMMALSRNLAAKYRFRLLPMGAFADADVTARGLRASKIVVREGARLTMPISATGAYALTPGATLSGAGAMLGSYAFGNGATLDLAAATPAELTDVQMTDGGTIRVDVTKPYTFESFSASGTVNVELVNYDEKTAPSKIALFAFENAPAIAPGTVWNIPGHKDCEFRMKNGKLVLCTRRGLVFVVQ